MGGMMRFLALALAVLMVAQPGLANPASESLRARASVEFYNLDNERALALYRQAVEADPQDPAAYRGVASALWTSVTFSRGMLTVDSYLGGISRQNLKMPPPPPEISSGFRDALNSAVALSRSRIAANRKNTDPQFDLGASMGL